MSSRDEYVSAIKSSFVTLAVKATQAWAATLSPFLAGPLVQKLISYLATKLFGHLATESELAVFFLYIDTRTSAQSKDFEAAALHNWKVQQNGTKEQKLEAEKILWERFKVFASLRA